jgi:hypothetical protein
MSKPKFDAVIEADLFAAIKAIEVEGGTVTFAAVARKAERSLSLISRRDTRYSEVRNRILSIQRSCDGSRVASDQVSGIPSEQNPSAPSLRELREALRQARMTADAATSAMAAMIVAHTAAAAGPIPQVADLERRRAMREQRLLQDAPFS